jgi:tRNA pseudouridine38-40 synthase
MNNYRLRLEYRGTAYSGWQAQKNADSVAGRVEKAARQVFHEVFELYGAGRTDAGVHALGQAAHLKAGRARSARANFRLALNDLLPPDIAVLEVQEMPEDFHARFDAKERVYLYQILRRRAAFGSEMSWWIKDRLDLKKIRAAAALLVGNHNFSSFSEQDAENPKDDRMDLRSLEVVEDGALLLLRFRARHFLWKQVRRMTGFLAEVGRGHWAPGKAKDFLEKPSRELAAFTAPPSGLFLEKVLYGPDRFEEAPKPVLYLGR